MRTDAGVCVRSALRGCSCTNKNKICHVKEKLNSSAIVKHFSVAELDAML